MILIGILFQSALQMSVHITYHKNSDKEQVCNLLMWLDCFLGHFKSDLSTLKVLRVKLTFQYRSTL